MPGSGTNPSPIRDQAIAVYRQALEAFEPARATYDIELPRRNRARDEPRLAERRQGGEAAG